MLGAWGGRSRVSTGTLVLEMSLFPCPSLQDACESLETPLDCEGDGCALAGLFHEQQADCLSVCPHCLPLMLNIAGCSQGASCLRAPRRGGRERSPEPLAGSGPARWPLSLCSLSCRAALAFILVQISQKAGWAVFIL